MRTHRPCLFLALAMATGILLGYGGFISWEWWGLLTTLAICLSVFFKKQAIVLLHAALICLGAFYYQASYIYPKDHIAFLSYDEQKKVNALKGVIDSDVQMRSTQYGLKKVFEFRITQTKNDKGWKETSGRVLVNCFKDVSLKYGDKLLIEGTLFKPKNNSKDRFSYQRYLERQGLSFILSVSKNKNLDVIAVDQGHWWMKIAFKMKHQFKKVLERYLPSQEVSIIQAMTLGDRSFLSKDMYALFSKTGTSHIMAISGMNMAIIGAMVLFVLKILSLPRRFQLILTAIFLLCYSVVCGFSASVVRSVLMAAVFLGSFCVEYESDGLNTLGFAALILFLLNPENLFDIGFQLSFICVLMIIAIYPNIRFFVERYIKNRYVGYIAQAFCISLIAWVGTMPLIAYHFDIVSLVSIIANVPVVILADMIVVLSFGLVMFGSLWEPLGFVFAGCLKAVFNLMLIIIYAFVHVPAGYFYVENISFWVLLGYYSLLMMGIIGWSILRKRIL